MFEKLNKNLINQILSKCTQQSFIISALPFMGKRTLFNILKYEIETKITNVKLFTLSGEKSLTRFMEEFKMYKDIKKTLGKVIIQINFFERFLNDNKEMKAFEQLLRNSNNSLYFIIGTDLSYLYASEKFNIDSYDLKFESIVMKLYSLRKTSAFIQEISSNDEKLMSLNQEIYGLSGGYPGLIKAITYFYLSNKNLGIKELLRDPQVNNKLNLIYSELQKLDFHHHQDIMIEVGLLNPEKKLNPILLKKFIENLKKDNDWRIEFSMQEEILFELFNLNPKKVFTLEELSNQIWGEGVDIKYSLWAMYKSISNLNKKLYNKRLKIKNLRGRGYILEILK